MKMFEVLLTPSMLVQSIGWALLHSLWQGIFISVLLYAALKVLRKSKANLRYSVAYLALMLMVIMPVFTVRMGGNVAESSAITDSTRQKVKSSNETKNVVATTEKVDDFQAETVLQSWDYIVKKQMEIWTPWLVAAWFLGVFACALRLSGVWIYTRKLRRKDAQIILEQGEETVARLSKLLRVKKGVLLLESSLVQVPTMVGWLKPLILLPPSAILNLTPQ